jgi:uncharacterized protein YegL
MKKIKIVPVIMLIIFALLMIIPVSAKDVQMNNVVIVLDASGSMNGFMKGSRIRKMSAAKSALREVLKNVPEDTNIGLLVFSGKGLKNDWVFPLGPRSDEFLNRAIDIVKPGGGTPLGAYIKKGADRLLLERKKQMGYGTYRLLIVTDGEAQDKKLMEAYTPDVMAKGIIMDVIGVNMGMNHTLARKVNSYRRADDPASLKKAIADVFAEVSVSGQDSVSKNVFQDIAPIPDEVAGAMIKALATINNDPVGHRRRIPSRRK